MTTTQSGELHMHDEPELAERERRLTDELQEVQRQLGDLFPPSAEPVDVSNANLPLAGRSDERSRLHERREQLRGEIADVRAQRAAATVKRS